MTGYRNTFLGKLLKKHDEIEPPPRFELFENEAEPRRSWEELAEEIQRIRQEQTPITEEPDQPGKA